MKIEVYFPIQMETLGSQQHYLMNSICETWKMKLMTELYPGYTSDKHKIYCCEAIHIIQNYKLFSPQILHNSVSFNVSFLLI